MGCVSANFYLTLLPIMCAAVFVTSDRGVYIGCYKIMVDNVLRTRSGESVDTCLTVCQDTYYKYAILANGTTCYCGNTPGQFQLPKEACDITCAGNSSQICGGKDAGSVYDTDVVTPGPPTSLQLTNVTETTVRVKWTAPEAYSIITSYIITADVLHTFAEFTLLPLEWSVSNSTFQSELLNLHPGTQYAISIVAMNSHYEGPNVTDKIETVIGTPEPGPPEIINKGQHGTRMVIQIPQAKNINGPVSMYRIIVSIELYQQRYLTENLGNYTAMAEGIPYYITAEIEPQDVLHDFIIGDGITYNGFYNAPLPLTKDIKISLGVVSERNNVRKTRYADSGMIILNINEPEEMSPLVIALGAGIAVGTVLLLIAAGVIIILNKKMQLVRMERSSQTMPLNSNEPCVEIENAGFLHEEDEKVDYYGNLKLKLWNIPRELLDIDISCIVGLGNYGKFTRGLVQEHKGRSSGLIQVVADKELERDDRREMLHELNHLIKTSEHENVISLIGICETSTTLYIVLEDTKQTLKDMLLVSRCHNLQSNKFSLIAEDKILEICSDVARGMEYLHNKKIVHKRLSCRNIVINDNGVAKVSGFGVSHIRPLHEVPDYTRWTSFEMLRQTRFNPKADGWSFGCLMWEVFTLGATPYASTESKDVATRVLRGMRPSQPSYVGDELFQLCLQCWQVDPDERPTFNQILQELTQLMQAMATLSISFTHYKGFSYEPHVPHYEVIS